MKTCCLTTACLILSVVVGCSASTAPVAGQPPGSAPPGPPPPPQAALQPIDLPPVDVGIHEQTAKLPSGATLRYTISIPGTLSPDTPVPLIVALHYGGDVTPFYGRGMIDELAGPAFKDLGAVIVAPDALSGADWTASNNEKAVVWLARSVMQSYPIDARRVLLTGFSMGGQGAWFIGGRQQDLFTAVIPVAGEPRGNVLDWKVPLYVIHSQQDEILALAPTQTHVERLKSKGADVELKVLSGLTHYQVPDYAQSLGASLPWLRDKWKR